MVYDCALLLLPLFFLFCLTLQTFLSYICQHVQKPPPKGTGYGHSTPPTVSAEYATTTKWLSKRKKSINDYTATKARPSIYLFAAGITLLVSFKQRDTTTVVVC